MKKMVTIFLICSSMNLLAQVQADTMVALPPVPKEIVKFLYEATFDYANGNRANIPIAIFDRLAEVKNYLDSPNIAPLTNFLIEKKILMWIQDNFFAGNALSWTPEKDNQFYIYEMDKKRCSNSLQRYNLLTNIQCLYFLMIQVPCPNSN